MTQAHKHCILDPMEYWKWDIGCHGIQYPTSDAKITRIGDNYRERLMSEPQTEARRGFKGAARAPKPRVNITKPSHLPLILQFTSIFSIYCFEFFSCEIRA